MDIQSQLYLSRANKRFHNIFKYNMEINMEDAILLMVKNRLKTKNNYFKSIFYLFLYKIREKGLMAGGFFHLSYHIYEFYVNIGEYNLVISNRTYGTEIKINEKEICYIENKKCVFNVILNIIELIYKYLEDNNYEIKNEDLYDNIYNYFNYNITKIFKILYWFYRYIQTK